jgi:type IV secretory pathway VirB10-like protein
MDAGEGPGEAPGSGSGEDRSGGAGREGRRSLRDLERQRSRELQRRFDRERGYRRAILAGIAVSVAVHLVLLFVLSGQLQLPRMTYRESPPTPVTMEGLELVRVETPEAQPAPARPQQPAERQPEPEEPDEEETEEPQEGQPTPVPSEEDAEGETEERLTNAERLSPKEGDSRVWRDFWDEDLRGRYLGGSARADSAIRAILGKYLDSLRLSEEAYRSARDWTVGEGEERWGVSPEGIHLGDITIPVPVGQLFQPTGPRRRELERELRELREIQRQERLGDVQETREERIEEMRERSRREAGEGESEADSTDTGGGGPR